MKFLFLTICLTGLVSIANAKVTDAMLDKLDNPKASENFRSQRERAASLFKSILQSHIEDFKKKLGFAGDLKMTVDIDSLRR